MINLCFLLIIAPLLTGYIIKYLNSRAYKDKRLVEKEWITGFIERAETVISTAVVATNQMLVEELKKAGDFTVERQKEAFNYCKNIVLEQLSDELKTVLHMLYNNVEKWIDTKIEYYVNIHKKANKT